MRYKDLPIGAYFKFWFEKNSQWAYKKFYNGILCVNAPCMSSSSVGQFNEISDELIEARVQQFSFREMYEL